MVVYGITTGNSIRRLFISGAIPGVLYGLGLMIAVTYIARRHGYPRSAEMTFREKLRSLRDAAWALLMPIVVIGGILTGVFTVTESAAIAAIYAIFTGVFVYRGIDSFRKVYEILRDSVVLISFNNDSDRFGQAVFPASDDQPGTQHGKRCDLLDYPESDGYPASHQHIHDCRGDVR